MLVGSIHLTAQRHQHVQRLDELGYFAFGGSTVVCVFRAGTVEFDADLLANSARQLETLVRVGDSLGRACAPSVSSSPTHPVSVGTVL